MSRYASTSTLLCAASLLAGAFVPVGGAHAAVRLVTNCNDSGSGSLRNTVASALSGDTIDMTGLTCSTILLTSRRDRGATAVAVPGRARAFGADHRRE